MTQQIILDTDIGDDIDDAYALALVLASPELELLGVTTVFGATRERAQQALTILKIAERDGIPVAAGCGPEMSPRPGAEPSGLRRWTENLLPCQQSSCLPWDDLPPLSPMHGVDFLIETILNGQGDIIP
ncbi:MAG: nucleoside hydrolase, partial [Candidatus Sumerlaeota bacterium]|nr:nucleoside hydrolase [Candidatus Sumerlaeota bacterium]